MKCYNSFFYGRFNRAKASRKNELSLNIFAKNIMLGPQFVFVIMYVTNVVTDDVFWCHSMLGYCAILCPY